MIIKNRDALLRVLTGGLLNELTIWFLISLGALSSSQVVFPLRIFISIFRT